MKEDDIAHLFDRDPQPEDEDEFAAAVRRAIARERWRVRLLASLAICGFVGIAVLLISNLPVSMLLPLQIAQAFLSSTTGMVASGLVACGVALTLKYAEP